MKKIVFLIALLLVPAMVYAAPKWVPTTKTVDSVVQVGPTQVGAMNVYWSGVTAGASVILKNGTTTAGDAVFTIVADTTAGSVLIPALDKSLLVDTGLYLDFTNASGTMGVQIFYQ